jgi:hypothetical protein
MDNTETIQHSTELTHRVGGHAYGANKYEGHDDTYVLRPQIVTKIPMLECKSALLSVT